MPAITSTFSRMHGEFLRLLFLQAHRETTGHFTAIVMPARVRDSYWIALVNIIV